MARLFDDAQSEYLTHAAAVRTATPFAFVCWFNSDDITIKQCLMAIGDADNDDNYFAMHLRGDQAGDSLQAALAQAGAGAAAITTSGYSVDTWHHGCAIYASSTDRRALIDGGSKGTDAVNKTPVAGNLDTTSVGILDRLNDYGPMSGAIAEAAIYDISAFPGATNALKADYFEANVLPYLAAKERPSAYSTGLLAYWDLVSDDDDKAGSYDMTPVNTPSWVQHPIVLCTRVEPANAVDSQNRTFITLASLTESGTAVDSQSCSAIFNASRTESASATDSQNGLRHFVAAILEAANATEVSDRALTHYATIVEAANAVATEDGLRYLTAGLTEAADAIDSQSCSAIFNSSILETASAEDLQNGLRFLDASISEIANAVDSQNKWLILASMPPEMQQALIDPYSGGAWLWLAEINIPGYEVIRLAQNPVDVNYTIFTYSKHNFDPGIASLAGDGSVPRTILKVVHDGSYDLEDKINATRGAGGGTIKIIRAHEDFLVDAIAELEQTINILTAESDTTHVIFQLGIPDPLLRKVPLRRYSSKICPYALPGLFKGPECQYAGEDGTCTGKYEDCLAKENATLWGADLGLDPNAIRV